MPAAQLAAALKAQPGGASPAGVAGEVARVAVQEAVFTAILGDPSKPLTKSSDEELAALARATGLDPAAMATMSREEKIAAITERRESVLRSAAQAAGVVGAETMSAVQLAAAVKAHAVSSRPSGVASRVEGAAEQEAVFTAILGDPTQSIAKCSDSDLAALARAAYFAHASSASRSRCRGEKFQSMLVSYRPLARFPERARPGRYLLKTGSLPN